MCATCKNIEFLPCLSVNLLLFANFLILIPTASTCFWSRSGSVYSSFVLNSSTGTFRISLPLSPPFLFVRFTFFFPPFIFIFYWQFHYHLINVWLSIEYWYWRILASPPASVQLSILQPISGILEHRNAHLRDINHPLNCGLPQEASFQVFPPSTRILDAFGMYANIRT